MGNALNYGNSNTISDAMIIIIQAGDTVLILYIFMGVWKTWNAGTKTGSIILLYL